MTKEQNLLASQLVRLNNLQLSGQLVSEEVMLGVQASKRTGNGTEFEQYRHYQAGDDPRTIDWKLYARSGKHLVRQSSVESNSQIRFLIDLSGSMKYSDSGVSRLDYAKVLLASLAYLGYLQNDLMSLYGLQSGKVLTLTSSLSASSGRQAFNKILFALQKAEAEGGWSSDNKPIRFPELHSKSTDKLIFVTDLLQNEEEWVRLISYLAGPRREITVFRILGANEVEFNLEGAYRFRDLETGKEIELSAEAVRSQYIANSIAFEEKVKRDLRLPFVKLITVRLDDPPAQVLKKYLSGGMQS